MVKRMTEPHKRPYRHPKYKTAYRVKNWREYDQSLRDRGNITLWLSQEAIDAWTPPQTGKRGAQPVYSDTAIETALTLRLLFGLPLRQTEGFLGSLLRLMDLTLPCPDHTTLSRRHATVAIRQQVDRAPQGPIDLIVDSTGLKVCGTKAVMRAGDVQRMSAGTGIHHSEFNLGEVPAHFYQIWIYPDTSGLPPSYDQKSFAGTVWTNRLVPMASGQGLPDVVTFHTDATVYLGALEAHRSVTHEINGARRVFVYLTEGELAVDDARLATKDQGRIDAEAPLTLTAHTDTRFVLIDVPSCRGWGYDQATLRGVGR